MQPPLNGVPSRGVGRRGLVLTCAFDADVTASRPPATPVWDEYSISYQHNLLAGPSQPKFDPKLNSSSGRAGTYTSAYTSLVQVGRCQAVLLYDLVDTTGSSKQHFGFSMQIDIHMDRGGEAGIHC